MESINLLRLKTGEDIICYMEDYGHDEIVVRDAMVVFVKNDFKTGKQTIMLEHWLPIQLIKENEAVIKVSEIVAKMNPTPEFNAYYENTVSVVHQVREESSQEEELSSSNDADLSAEDMKLILDMVGPTNLMH